MRIVAAQLVTIHDARDDAGAAILLKYRPIRDWMGSSSPW